MEWMGGKKREENVELHHLLLSNLITAHDLRDPSSNGLI